MTVQLNANEFIPTQREEVKKRINQILDDFMEALVTSTIIREIKAIAHAANIPQGFIDGIEYRRVSPNKFQVVNTWGTTETPLAKFFNYGTITHWIEPKNKKALAFPNKSGRNAPAIYFKGSKNPSGTLFSKGHYVAGVPRTEAMERGFNIGIKQLAVEAGKIVQKELN